MNFSMFKFSKKTIFEVLAGVSINLTAGWFGLLAVSPGFLGSSSVVKNLSSLTINISLGIVGLFSSLVLTEWSKKL